MKVTPDRIKARADQLRTHGFKLRAGMVRATLELNSGTGEQLYSNPEAKQEAVDRQERTRNTRDTVRTLHFPAAAPADPANHSDEDTQADAIRNAWRQKSASSKPAA